MAKSRSTKSSSSSTKSKSMYTCEVLFATFDYRGKVHDTETKTFKSKSRVKKFLLDYLDEHLDTLVFFTEVDPYKVYDMELDELIETTVSFGKEMQHMDGKLKDFMGTYIINISQNWQ